MCNWREHVSFQELLKETRQEWSNRVVELLYSIFCLDMQQITLTLLGTILPNLLTDSAHWQSLVDPPGKALAKYVTLAAYPHLCWQRLSVDLTFSGHSAGCACGARSALSLPTTRARSLLASAKGSGKTLR